MRHKSRLAVGIMMLVFCATPAVANGLDGLVTLQEVNAFLSWRFPELKPGGDILDASKAVPAGFGKNTFYKFDLDRNGRTDLIVDGRVVIAVVDPGDDNYELHYLDGGPYSRIKYTLTSIDRKTKPVVLSIRSYATEQDDLMARAYATEKRLVYLYGAIFEHNERPSHLSFERIRFSTSGCLGSCPIIDITIDQNRNLVSKPPPHEPDKRPYTSRMTRSELEKITNIIDYMDLPHIRDADPLFVMDDQTAILEVTYDHGKAKKVRDYGLTGTQGVKALYREFLNLQNTLKWSR